jgi:hypothetical protein
MPDRSPQQGLPEDWDHGSHTASGPFSTAGAADGYGAGPSGSYRARTGPTDAYGAAGAAGVAKSDPLGIRADSYGAGMTDAFGIRPADTYSAGPANTFGAGTANTFGAGAVDTHGARAADPFGDANPFGDADPFASRGADPFGPSTTGAFGTKPAAFAPATADAETARPDAERPVAAIGDQARSEAADARGFLSALFDFGFTSFVTPKVIRVLYTLIMVGTVLSALVFTVIVFKASVPFGILTLVFGDPLFILIVLAIYRVLLEFFMVIFRVAEDIRAMRERDDLR